VEVLVNRRDFFKYGALGTVLTPACHLADAQPQTSAPATGSARSNGRELALINAKIITLDARQPRAEAALIGGGRIALTATCLA
jgi:hypothetical protein